MREWDGRDEELQRRREELGKVLQAAYTRDPEVTAVYMGQSAAFADARPAGEVLRRICDEAEHVLRERAPRLLG